LIGSEGVRVMARTLRCVAHANGASLLYTSAKSKLSLQAVRTHSADHSLTLYSNDLVCCLSQFRIRLKSFLMQQAWPKQTTTDNNDGKEQIYQAGIVALCLNCNFWFCIMFLVFAGSDFFEKIGVAPAPHDNSRNLTAGWLAAAAACFPSSTISLPLSLSISISLYFPLVY
jgi:hypothetical protein